MTSPRRDMDPTIKAIARAFRWREMLESGTYATIGEIAGAEKISDAYVSRIMRLTLLAPDIIETILAGQQAEVQQLGQLMRPFPVTWKDQREAFGPSQ